MEHVSWRHGDVDELVDRAERVMQGQRRAVLGIAGAPASGKSTLAGLLAAELRRRHPGEVAEVGMDAFHIGHRLLVGSGLDSVKGAPHTFDVLGYVALLERLRDPAETVYAPEFDRDIEDSLAQVVEVAPAVRLVVTEGNYLLLPQPPWDRVRALLDGAWFIHLDDEERQRRMVARHRHFGHSFEVARARTYGTDETNARLVNSEQNSPDVWVEQVS